MPDADVLRAWGANYGPLTLNGGQWWRVFTSGFVHMGILHVGLNMWVLHDVGLAVEELYGPSKFFAIYLLSMVGGCLCSLFINPVSPGVGASGAVLGSFGALLAFWWIHKNLFPPEFTKQRSQVVVFLLACTLLSGFFTPGLDNAAHIGGLFFGFVAGYLLMPRSMNVYTWSVKDALAVLGLCVLFLAAGWLDHRFLYQRNNNVVALNLSKQGSELLKQHKYEEALKKFNELVQRMPEMPSPYGSRAEALMSMNRFDDAIKDSNRCIMLAPHDPSGYFLRALIYHKMGQDQKSLPDLDSAVRYGAAKPDPYNNRAWTYLILGKYQAALDDANKAIKLDPMMSAAYDTRGLAYYFLGNRDDAMADFDMAIKLNLKDGAAYYHRYLITHSQDDLKKSEELKYEPEEWEKGAREDPGAPRKDEGAGAP